MNYFRNKLQGMLAVSFIATREAVLKTEKAKGTADVQADLAKSQVGVDIHTDRTAARRMEAEGEATFIEQTGAGPVRRSDPSRDVPHTGRSRLSPCANAP